MIKRLLLVKLFGILWVLNFAQSSTYSYLNEAPKALTEVLALLEEQNGIVFSYQVSALKNLELPACSVKKEDLETFLNTLFANQQLEYKIVDQQRVLLRRSLLDTPQAPRIEKIILSGSVTDSKTKQALSDVAVYLDTLALGALTDEAGNFSFEIPENMQDRQVIAQIIGYEQKRVSVQGLKKNGEIAIQANPVSLGPVTVTETIPVLQNKSSGAIQLNTSPLLQNNGSSLAGNDLFRSIQTLPGISANNDLSAAVKIRGSSGDETLTILDGIPIYKAEHYFGVFSAINANYVQSTEVYKNALPVAYGGKTGGMLLMESEGSRYNRTNGIIDINLLNTSLVFNSPIGNKLSLILSGRTTYSDAADNPLFNAFEDNLANVANDATQGLGRPGLIETTPSFSFYDWNAKLLYKINDRQNLSFSFYRSFDDLLNDYEQSYNVRTPNDRPAIDEESFSNAEAWENTGASLRYKLSLKNDWAVNATGYYTEYKNDGLIESELSREIRDLELSLWSFENNQENKIEDVGFNVHVLKKKDYNRSIILGAEVIKHQNEFELFEDEESILNGQLEASDWSLFGAFPLINQPKFHLDVGARSTYYSLQDQWFFSPRINTTYQLGDGFNLKGSWSISNQFVREVNYENRLGQNIDFFLLSNQDEFAAGTSRNIMLGASYRTGAFLFDVELYNKYQTGEIEFRRIAPGFDSERIRPSNGEEYNLFVGEGFVQGLDVLVEFKKEKYHSWLSYTLSLTENQFKEIYRNERFPAEDDRRHQISFVNNYQMGRFNFSANFTYASGRPFTDLSKLAEAQKIKDLRFRDLINRLPSYNRLDLGVNYTFDVNWTKMTFGLSVFNVTNASNVSYQQYIYALPHLKEEDGKTKVSSEVVGTTTRLLDRTLNLSMSLKF